MSAGHTTRNSAKARPSLPRMALLAVSLFAFILQGYATATHIHGGNTASEGGIAALSTKAASADASGRLAGNHDKQPAKDDTAACPLCQAALKAGAFISPSPLTFTLPQYGLSLAPLVVALPSFVAAVSHSWHGRAPPRH